MTTENEPNNKRRPSSVQMENAIRRYAATSNPKQYLLEAFDEWLADEEAL